MGAVILPSDEDFSDPAAAKGALDEARADIYARPADVNEATEEYHEGNKAQRHAEHREQQRAEREKRAEPDSSPSAPTQPEAVPQRDFRAELEAARQHAELLDALALQQASQREARPAPTGDTPSSEDDEVEFFRSPSQAVARAVSQHPVIAGLKSAITETFQHKTSEQFAKEFPDHQQIVADPQFREWASASPVRVELLKAAHGYDLDAARHVFSAWNAVRGAAAGAKASSGKTRVYRRADVQRLMTEDSKRYERMADEIARAYVEGRVK